MPTDHAILVRTTWGWMNGSMSCRCIPASRSAGSRARAPSYPGGDGDYYVLTTCVPSSAPLVADAIGCVHTTVPAAPVNYEISLSRHTVFNLRYIPMRARLLEIHEISLSRHTVSIWTRT